MSDIEGFEKGHDLDNGSITDTKDKQPLIQLNHWKNPSDISNVTVSKPSHIS